MYNKNYQIMMSLLYKFKLLWLVFLKQDILALTNIKLFCVCDGLRSKT